VKCFTSVKCLSFQIPSNLIVIVLKVNNINNKAHLHNYIEKTLTLGTHVHGLVNILLAPIFVGASVSVHTSPFSVNQKFLFSGSPNNRAGILLFVVVSP
jgi:hypothetical protein